MSQCHLLQAGEIQAVVGDASRNGVGGPQYCGLWSLTSKHHPFNAFGNSYAGLIPGEIRGRNPVLQRLNDRTCVLTREPDHAYPVRARAEYTITAPSCIDHELRCADHADARCGGCAFRAYSWCCYMNCPEDPRLHMRSAGEWFRYISPEHGVGSNIAPAYVPEEELETYPPRQWRHGRWHPFHWDRIEPRFDLPFYYGRLGPMVFLLVFDTPPWLRFFCSPSGGGASLLPGRTCPAWDFMWVVPERDYQVGREYRFRVRLVYKPFVSDDDCLAEYERACGALGFERVSP